MVQKTTILRLYRNLLKYSGLNINVIQSIFLILNQHESFGYTGLSDLFSEYFSFIFIQFFSYHELLWIIKILLMVQLYSYFETDLMTCWNLWIYHIMLIFLGKSPYILQLYLIFVLLMHYKFFYLWHLTMNKGNTCFHSLSFSLST